jgi:uncharacterized membrane protein YphA (DoxX/SURF4 family)
MRQAMGWLDHPRVVRACQIALGVLFAGAALAKLGDLGAFATQVHNYRIVPVATENLLALTLPWIELIAALALILNVRARAGAAVITAMLAVFTVGVVVAMSRGLNFECGCFGTFDATRVGMGKVAQNLGMLAMGGIAVRRPR